MYELLALVIFLGLTVTTVSLVTLRKRHFKDDSDVWVRLFTGLVLLDISLLPTCLKSFELTEHLAVVSDEFLRITMSTIIAMGGLLLLFSGFVMWLPTLTRSRHRYQKVGRLLDLFYNINALSNSHYTSERIIADAMNLIYESIEPKKLVYLGWDRPHKLLKTVHIIPQDSIDQSDLTIRIDQLEQIVWLRNPVIERRNCRSRIITSEIGSDLDLSLLISDGGVVASLPLSNGKQAMGVLLLSFEAEADFEEEDVETLQLILDSIGTTLDRREIAEENMRLCDLKDSHDLLIRAAIESPTPADLLTSSVRLFQRFVPFDMLTIAVLDENHTNMKRYSISESGNKVSEMGLSLPVDGTLVGNIAASGRPDISTQLADNRSSDDQWLSRCGFGSRLSLPVRVGERTAGVVSFVSVGDNRYSRALLDAASLAADAVAIVINNLISRDKLICRSIQTKSSWELLSKLVSEESTESYFEEFVKQVTLATPVTFCRMFTYDSAESQLHLVTEYNRRNDTEDRIPARITLNLSDMPQHRAALVTGEVLLINQSDPDSRASDDEVKLGFPDSIHSALLIPLKVDDKVKGLVSLGEMRDWQRRSFSEEDTAFARTVAAQASLSLALAESRAAVRHLRKRESRSDEGYMLFDALSGASRRLAGSVSAIMGAAELLERNVPSAEGQMSECIRRIIRSSDRAFKELREIDDYRRTAPK